MLSINTSKWEWQQIGRLLATLKHSQCQNVKLQQGFHKFDNFLHILTCSLSTLQKVSLPTIMGPISYKSFSCNNETKTGWSPLPRCNPPEVMTKLFYPFKTLEQNKQFLTHGFTKEMQTFDFVVTKHNMDASKKL